MKLLTDLRGRSKFKNYEWIGLICADGKEILALIEFSSDISLPPLVEDPERFYRSGEK